MKYVKGDPKQQSLSSSRKSSSFRIEPVQVLSLILKQLKVLVLRSVTLGSMIKSMTHRYAIKFCIITLTWIFEFTMTTADNTSQIFLAIQSILVCILVHHNQKR